MNLRSLSFLRDYDKIMTIIQCYAPTSTSSDDEINSFYETITEAINHAHESEWFITMGDFTSKIGITNDNEDDVMGKLCIGERNERGKLFINFARSQELFIRFTNL